MYVETLIGTLRKRTIFKVCFSIPAVPDKDLCKSLVEMFLSFVDTGSLSSFAELFLLRSNSSQLRWQAHQLLYCLFQCSSAPSSSLSWRSCGGSGRPCQTTATRPHSLWICSDTSPSPRLRCCRRLGPSLVSVMSCLSSCRL